MAKTTHTFTIEVNTETSGITVSYEGLSAEMVLGCLRLASLHEEEQLRELWRARKTAGASRGELASEGGKVDG